MTPVVHVLSTVRRHQLLPAALLVFKTLRVGFPTAKVICYPNDLTDDPRNETAIVEAATAAGCELAYTHESTGWTHPGWIRHVIENNEGWNVILDTDMVFYSSVEDWDPVGSDIMGMAVPAFRCPYTRAITLPRIHTCLAWLNCDYIKNCIKHGDVIEMAPMDLISPCTFWNKGAKYFHDTLGQLHACSWVAAKAFTDSQLDAFTHLFSGTLLDAVGPCVPGLADMHRLAYEDPAAVRGAWRQQQRFYEQNKV